MSFAAFHQDRAHWERLAFIELYNEYQNINRERRLQLKPVRIELTDALSFWGKWDQETRTIYLSRKLLFEKPWSHVLGVLKHEMAHQWVDERSEIKDESPHGEQFKRACERLGLPQVFSQARVDLSMQELDWREVKPEDDVSEKMLERVRKLLNLATSSNENEALSAMNRVREIYAKYNLENSSSLANFVHTYISIQKKRLSAPEQKIIGILVGHFFVQVIVGRAYDVMSGSYHRQIEIIGNRENVLMAEYVFYFLKNQSQTLTDLAAKKSPEKWAGGYRRSYHLGVLQGFDEKLSVPEEEKDGESLNISKALMLFRKDKKLDQYITTVYPRLTRLTSRSRLRDRSAYLEGQKMGRKLTLKKPISSKIHTALKFLSGC